MRDPLVIGILKESKGFEHRAPLVPSDVELLVDRGITVEVESSSGRVFSDREYKKNGATIVDKVQKATFLVGLKEPRVHDLLANKIYMVFSHTAKGQVHNMPLLRACLKKKITLIDYEQVVDLYGARLVYFGRFAGICGMVDSLHYFGKKMEWKGIRNPFTLVQPAHNYESLEALKRSLEEVGHIIRDKGFAKELSPFILGITGHGNVSTGAQEVLDLFNPVAIHPRDMSEFITDQGSKSHRVYKIVLLREEKFRSIKGNAFYFEDYLSRPKDFESNLDIYLPFMNLLIHTSYWDKHYPRLVTKKMINTLSKKELFRLEFIGDLSCDIRGSIEITEKTTSRDKPTFTYSPINQKFSNGYRKEGVTVLAVDNLPAEMPRDASVDFSGLIRDYVYQIAAHGITDITKHMAIPSEIRKAVVTQDGELSTHSSYLRKYL